MAILEAEYIDCYLFSVGTYPYKSQIYPTQLELFLFLLSPFYCSFIFLICWQIEANIRNYHLGRTCFAEIIFGSVASLPLGRLISWLHARNGRNQSFLEQDTAPLTAGQKTFPFLSFNYCLFYAKLFCSAEFYLT